MIRVGRLMTRDMRTCHPEDTLADASRLMWDADVGCLPVTARSGHLVAMITDRDIAMSAWLSGRPLREQRVSDAMSRRLVTVQEEDEAGVLEDVMRTAQVHRVPVVDEVGFLRGIVTLNDLAHHRHGKAVGAGVSPDEVATTLAIISTPRAWSFEQRLSA